MSFKQHLYQSEFSKLCVSLTLDKHYIFIKYSNIHLDTGFLRTLLKLY